MAASSSPPRELCSRVVCRAGYMAASSSSSLRGGCSRVRVAVLRSCARIIVTAWGLYGRVGGTDAGHVAVVARAGCERVVSLSLCKDGLRNKFPRVSFCIR